MSKYDTKNLLYRIKQLEQYYESAMEIVETQNKRILELEEKLNEQEKIND